jgi:diguanylate cyclase (GGDEF)-like protein
MSWQSSVWVGWSLIVGSLAMLVRTSPTVLLTVGPTLLVLLAMVTLGELRPIVASSVREADGVPLFAGFVFAALYLWGLAPAVLLLAVAVAISESMGRKPLYKWAFNIGQYVVALTAAWLVLAAAGVQTTLSNPRTSFQPHDLRWILLSWVAYHAVNLALVAGLAAPTGVTWWESFTDEIWYYTFSTFAVLAMAPFVVVMAANAWQFLPLLLLPVFGVYKLAAVAKAQERQAMHDALTDLPNRTLFSKSLQLALEDVEREGGGAAVFLLDLDRFKEVNDTLGHPAGDELLEIVARRISSAVRPDDVVARLGGDEFAVLLPAMEDAYSAIEIAGRIKAALAVPVRLEGVLMDVDVSIGIALAPTHGSDSEVLMRRADVAMYVAKGEQTGIEVYDSARDPNSPQRLGTVTALREALDQGHLELHYQPKVGLLDGAVLGTEALVRWRHPERGLIQPDEFVPLAERTGLVHRLTAYVLRAALTQVSDWWREGLQVPVAINVSMRDLQEPDLAELVVRELRRNLLPPGALTLEVTESVLVQDAGQAVETLRQLAQLGVLSSLDDFGTGYSSLSLLEKLPVSEVKIDRSFVRRIDDGDSSMVGAIVGFAHGLGLSVVAEGVETIETWQALCDMKCDIAQGYHVARPMPAPQATEWLMQRVRRPGVTPEPTLPPPRSAAVLIPHPATLHVITARPRH